MPPKRKAAKATGKSAKAKKTKTDGETVGFIQRDLATKKSTRTSSRAKKAMTEEDACDEALELLAASRSTRASVRAKKAQAEADANDDNLQDSAESKTTKTSAGSKNARTEKASDDDFPRNNFSLFGEVVNRALGKRNTAEDSEEEDSSDDSWGYADRARFLEDDDDYEEGEEEEYDRYDEEVEYNRRHVPKDMDTAEPARTWGQPKRVGFLVDDNDEDEDDEDEYYDEIQRQRARKRRREAQAGQSQAQADRFQFPEDDSGDVPEDVVAAEPARVWSRADGFQSMRKDNVDWPWPKDVIAAKPDLSWGPPKRVQFDVPEDEFAAYPGWTSAAIENAKTKERWGDHIPQSLVLTKDVLEEMRDDRPDAFELVGEFLEQRAAKPPPIRADVRETAKAAEKAAEKSPITTEDLVTKVEKMVKSTGLFERTTQPCLHVSTLR